MPARLCGNCWLLQRDGFPPNPLIDTDGSREKITPAGNGANDLLRVIAQYPADLHQTLGQRIVGNGNVLPDGFDKLVFADKTSCPVNKIGEYFEVFRT